MLKLKQIRDVAASALLHERLFHGSLLNCPGEKTTPDWGQLYFNAAKINSHARYLVMALNKLHETLTDFDQGEFDQHIDQHTKFAEEGDEAFDPYEELGYLLSAPYSIYALPETITQYLELLFFAENHSQRKKSQHEAFKSFFPGLETHYVGTDADGNKVMVNEADIDEDTKVCMEAKREIRHIETEHCLDNYNLWYQKMKAGIAERKPFAELLMLFK